MEVSLIAGMNQSPIDLLAIQYVLSNCSHPKFECCTTVNLECFQGHDGLERLIRRTDSYWWYSCFLSHAFSVAVKMINIPICGWREIDFPVLHRVWFTDKEFETCCFPQFIFPRWIRRFTWPFDQLVGVMKVILHDHWCPCAFYRPCNRNGRRLIPKRYKRKTRHIRCCHQGQDSPKDNQTAEGDTEFMATARVATSHSTHSAIDDGITFRCRRSGADW